MRTLFLSYLALFALAAAEASPLGYLIPGTLAIIAAGGLVQAGKLNGASALYAVFSGVLVGDVVSYWCALRFGNFIRQWKPVAAQLERAECRLRQHPVAFMILSHVSPYLKNIVGTTAGLSRFPWLKFISLEIPTALLDAFWFLFIGFVISAGVGNVTEIPLVARIVGVIAVFGVSVFFIGRNRKCVLPSNPSKRKRIKRGMGFLVKCALLIGPWELAGRLAKHARFYDRPDYRAALTRAVDLARPGDVILVGRKHKAPWGHFSHAMMVVLTPVGKALIHAYGTGVQLVPVKAAPMCGRVAVLRIECTHEQCEAMLTATWSQLATPFRIGSHLPESTVTPSALNCVGLVAWAAGNAGLILNGSRIDGRLVPDDLLSAPNVQVVFAWRAGDSAGLVLEA